jgi:methionyl aminopeptidase
MRKIPIKTPAELELMRQAGRLAAAVLKRVSAAVAPGVTTAELDALAARTMKELGVVSAFLGYMNYPANICISVNDSIIHGIPGQHIVKEGDVVSLDVGVWYKGFAGDNAETIVVGQPDKDTERLVRFTEEALMAGVAACRGGARLGDVSHAVERVAILNGLAVVREFVGHGIGRALHEDPQIPNFGPPRRGPILKPGMVLCIEPMFNLGSRAIQILDDGWTVVTRDGRHSAHFEHMVAVTDDTPEILTPRPLRYAGQQTDEQTNS